MKNNSEDIKELKAVIIGETFTRHLFPLNEKVNDLLIPVCSVPYIEYVIDLLLSNGVTQMIFVIKNNFQSIENYIKTNLKDLLKKNNKLIHIVHNDEINSVGDCLREVYKENLIQSDFLLIRGFTITNFSLEKALKFHFENKKKDKNLSMTSIFKSLKNAYGNRTTYDENIIIIDKNTKQILQYESKENMKCIKLNANVKFDLKLNKIRTFQVKTNIYDSFIDICTPEILSHFTDNFDYREVRDDLYKNYLVSDMYLDTFYFFELESDVYCNTIKNMQSYLKVTSELLNRWAYPLAIENLASSKKLNINFIYSHNNVYLGTSSSKENNASQNNLSRLNSFSDFRTSNLGNLGNLETGGNGIHVSVDITSSLHSACLGSLSILEAKASVFNSVIGKNNYIGKDSKIYNSVLLDDVDIGPGVEIRNSIIGTGTKVREGIKEINNSYLGSNLDIHDANDRIKGIDAVHIKDVRINQEVDYSGFRASNFDSTINERIGSLLNDDDEEEEEEEQMIYTISNHQEFMKSLDDLDLVMMAKDEPKSSKNEKSIIDENIEEYEMNSEKFSECGCENEDFSEEEDDFEKPIRDTFEKRGDTAATIQELVLMRKAYWDNTEAESKIIFKILLAFKAYIFWLFDDYLNLINESSDVESIQQHLGNIIGKWKDLFIRTLNNDRDRVEAICVIEKAIETRPLLENTFNYIIKILIQNGIFNKSTIEDWKKLQYSSYRYFVKNQYDYGEERINQDLHILLSNLI